MESKSLVDILRQHPFLEGFRPEHVEKMAGMTQEVELPRDHRIFREGEEADQFYLLLSGRVALEVSAPGRIVRIQTLGEGDELGWSSLLEGGIKQFQARTLEPVRALVFQGTQLRQACEEECAFGYALERQILKVVSSRLQATRLQLLDLYAPRGVKPI